MKRRDFLSVTGASAVAVAFPQQAGVRRIYPCRNHALE